MKPFILCFLLAAAGLAMAQEKVFFGVVADVQYADKEANGSRHYSASLGKLEACVEELNRRKPAFTIQLGDLIDGNGTPESTLADLDRVLASYRALAMPTYHVVGNHCLSAGKAELRQRLGLASFYYDFTVPEARGWRFVVLDGNDAGYGRIGEEQLSWLQERLTEARANGETVVVFNHFPLAEGAAGQHRMNDAEPLQRMLRDSGCVVAYMAGHDHAGGYVRQDGIHHITIKGMVETPNTTAFALVGLSAASLTETGFGREPSRTLLLDQRPQTPSPAGQP